MLRRTFLETTVLMPLAAAVSEPGIKLGFDTYSIRAWRWKAPQFLDYAAGLKLDTVQLSSLGDYESLAPAYLANVKDQAARLGIEIDAGTGCICPSSASYREDRQGPAPEYVRHSLRVAHDVGAKVMRCYMGASPDRRGKLPLEAHMENTVKVFRAVRNEALDLGVKIGLENHSGDMQAREVKTIIEESGPDFVGSCLDTGNPMWVCEDPLLSLEILHPYVVTTHIRDSAVYEHPRGAAAQWVALGDGSIDFAKFIARYRELGVKASMQLEIITGRKPTVLPYLEPEFWTAFRKTPAWEFARFVALAKAGHPFMGDMVIEDGNGHTFDDALKTQQKLDLERSFEYGKKNLGLGIKWRG